MPSRVGFIDSTHVDDLSIACAPHPGRIKCLFQGRTLGGAGSLLAFLAIDGLEDGQVFGK